MGKPSVKEFLCLFCGKVKHIRARKGQKYCSVECSKNIQALPQEERRDTALNVLADFVEDINIGDMCEAPDVIVKQYLRKNNILQTKAKNLETENKLLRNNINFSENISVVLRSAISALPKISVISAPLRSAKYLRDEEAVLLLSDLHASSKTTLLETDGLAEYSFEVFTLRMQKLLDSIVSITDIQRAGGARLDVLNVFALGDLISGIIHPELILTNDMQLVQSCMQVSLVIAQFIAKLSTIYKQVKFTGISGNHDRLEKNKVIKTKWADFSRIIYESISLLTQNYKNIQFDIPQSPFTIVKIYEWKYLITHGDCGVKGNIVGGVEKLYKEFQELYRTRGGIDLLICAHYHQPVSVDGALINGSMCGGDEYSIFALRKNTDPSQKFFGVNKEHRTTWMYDVFVKNTPPKHTFIYNKDVLAIESMKTWNNK